MSITRRPPAGIASRALSARLTRTCSIWPGSAMIGGRSAAGRVIRMMCSPIERRSICSTSAMALVEVQHLRPDHLAAGEREQLVGQVGAALAGPDDLLGVGDDRGEVRVRRSRLLDDEPGVVDDHAEQVVEVVGDAAGELAEALQPLGAVQLRLDPLPVGLGPQPGLLQLGVQPLGDVADHRDHEPARVGLHRGQRRLSRELRAVAPPHGQRQGAHGRRRGRHRAAAAAAAGTPPAPGRSATGPRAARRGRRA